MIHQYLPPFFDQYNQWIWHNKFLLLVALDIFMILRMILAIKERLYLDYWNKKEVNYKFFAKWISEKDFRNLL